MSIRPDLLSVDWVADRCLRVALRDPRPTAEQVHHLAGWLRSAGPPGLRDLTAGYASVLLTFDPVALDARRVEGHIRAALSASHADGTGLSITTRSEVRPSPPISIPVCYSGDCAPDIDEVARGHGLTAEEVAALHSGAEYIVRFIGFAPGFPYLDGLPERLATPRLDRPRTRVPAGSVGIAGNQTGIYPHATPGGWRLIGRTPVRLFDPNRNPPSLLAAGDRVRFVPIPMDRLVLWRQESTTARPESLSAGGACPAGRSGLAGAPSSSMPFVHVVEPGMLTTVQDLGREGFGTMGVPIGGAADTLSLRLGNRLVGNEEGAAALEITLVGGTFEFEHDAVIALTGGDIDAAIESASGVRRCVDRGTPIVVRAGDHLRAGVVARGCRAYLCVAGGMGVPRVLGSASTHLGAGFGGIEGRALRGGDRVALGGARGAPTGRSLPPAFRALIDETITRRVIRAVEGAHARMFDPSAVETFWRSEFVVSPQSDRMGLRLEGPRIASPAGGRLASEPMPQGAVQIPADGNPIVLMPDYPTTGGYPALACAATVDLPVLGQLRPGDRIRFQRVSVAEALDLLRRRERTMIETVG